MQSGKETFFKLKLTIRMSKLFAAYASRKGVQPSALQFFLDGEHINSYSKQTVQQLGMEVRVRLQLYVLAVRGCGAVR